MFFLRSDVSSEININQFRQWRLPSIKMRPEQNYQYLPRRHSRDDIARGRGLTTFGITYLSIYWTIHSLATTHQATLHLISSADLLFGQWLVEEHIHNRVGQSRELSTITQAQFLCSGATLDTAARTLRPRENCRHFAYDILNWIFLNENVWISRKISLKFVPKFPIDSKSKSKITLTLTLNRPQNCVLGCC